MNKHTQEEWLIAGDNGDFVYALGPNGGNKFWAAVSSAGSDSISAEEKAANARLIAAAPDLLEALIGMVDAWNMVCDANGWERDHIKQQVNAVQAIAKATGAA